jgi:hypothetical protein
MKKLSTAACLFAAATAFSPAHADPTDTIPAQASAHQYPGNLAIEKLIDDWSGRLVTNHLFQNAEQAQEQIDKQNFVHQVFELFVPVPAQEGTPHAFAYNPQSQQLTVRLEGDHKIKAVAFVEQGVHPTVYAYPLYFLTSHKEHGSMTAKTRSGLLGEINNVSEDREQFALVNLPYADPASGPLTETIPLPAMQAQSVARHAMWHMTVETELVPSQKKFIPEDTFLLGANLAFPTRYRTESYIVTVALKHADLIDTSDNKIVLSIDQNDINAFQHRQSATVQTATPGISDRPLSP